jgi:hypothetical protein
MVPDGDDESERQQLFDDMPEDVDGFEVSNDSSDREILYAIWTRNEIGDLPADEAWAILYERYPTESRFLLLNAYEELTQQVPQAWTPSYFLKKLVRVRKDGASALAQPLRDVLTVAWPDVFRDDLPKGVRREIAELTDELGVPAKQSAPTDDDVNEAYARLSRFASSVLKEFHDKTLGGAPIGPSRRSSNLPAGSFDEMLSRAKGPERPYAATEKYRGGDLVRHPKFGVGVVSTVVSGRAEILFKDGPRKLVCG